MVPAGSEGIGGVGGQLAVPAETKAQAKDWVDKVNAGRGLGGSWRLQVVQKRYRRRRDGSPETECSSRPMRIRRFVTGCPWTLVDQAIRYLVSTAPYSGIVYNGLPLEGTYRPTNTMWTRDEQTSVNEARPRDGTYTLVQDLVAEDEGCPDEYVLDTEETCSYVEETKYVWEADSVEELPGCGGGCQGVSWSLQAVQRNGEDDTYDYRVVKRTAKTQHLPETDTVCNTCAGRRTSETWRNLYGTPTALVTDGGSPVAFPACDPVPGVTVQKQLSQNQDCTYNLEIARTYVLERVAEWTDGTACRTRETEVVRNSGSEPFAPAASVGESVQFEKSRNDDCTWDSRTVVSRASAPFEVSWTDGSACRPVSHVSLRDQTSRPSVPAAAPGERVDARLQRNDDCTWDADFSIVAPMAADSFTTVDGTARRTRSTTEYDRSAGLPRIPAAGAGETVQASFRKNEDDCTYSGQVSVTKAPSPSSYSWTDGSLCRPRTVTVTEDRLSQPVVPAAAPGETVDAQVSRKDDDTWDAKVSVTAPAAELHASWTEGSSGRTTTTQYYQSMRSRPDVATGSQGENVQASLRFDDRDCTWSGQISKTESSPHVDSWEDGSSCGSTRVVTMVRNVRSRPGVPSASVGNTVRAQRSENDDGTWDAQTVVETALPSDTGWITWTAKDVGIGRTVWYDCGIRIFKNQTSVPPVGAGDHGYAFNVTPNDDCTYSGRIEYRDVSSWEATGDEEGGIQEGAIRVPVTCLPAPDLVSAPRLAYRYVRVRTYYGSGNQGSRAASASNQIILPGVNLGGSTYIYDDNGGAGYKVDPTT